jgi:predicted small secreted protein
MRKIRTWTCLALLASFVVAAAGCNTTEGFGRDLERGGEKLQQKANEHK